NAAIGSTDPPRARVPFRRAYPAIVDTATRPAVALQTRWIAGAGPHLDPDTGLWVRNPVLTPETPEKRKGLCLVSPEFQSEAGEWMEEDLDNGIVHVIHDWQGRPVERLDGN